MRNIDRHSFEKLGLFLKQKRKAAGVRQREIAKVFGYTSSQFVSNWERGLCAPPFDALPVLCKMLHISRRQMISMVLEETEADLKVKFNNLRSDKTMLKRI
jgi:transcriptional regulator with XRE-family HTH domain